MARTAPNKAARGREERRVESLRGDGIGGCVLRKRWITALQRSSGRIGRGMGRGR